MFASNSGEVADVLPLQRDGLGGRWRQELSSCRGSIQRGM